MLPQQCVLTLAYDDAGNGVTLTVLVCLVLAPGAAGMFFCVQHDKARSMSERGRGRQAVTAVSVAIMIRRQFMD